MNIKVGIIGAIVTIFTIAAFFLLGFERLAIHWWALTFLLLSEIIFFGGIMGLSLLKGDHNKVFLRTGISTALFLYLIATVIGVILFVGIVRLNLNYFILIHLAIVSLFGIAAVLILAASRRIAASDEKSYDAVGETKAKRGGF